jgi:cyclophilin family peptidyl-prolyl cis-trans isomerase
MAEGRDRRLVVLAAFALIAAGIVVAILVGRGGDEDEGTAAGTASGCQKEQAPEPKSIDLAAPEQTVKRGEKLTAVVETSCGTFEIALDARQSPKTVSSFAYLARNSVYDHTTFHRIVPGFVIQGGDPLGTGRGGPGYSIYERPPADIQYRRGMVAMARTQVEPPGRSGSQFFVVTAADAGLPPNYAVLGKVSSGREVVDRIASLGDPESGQTGTPRATVVIRKITVRRG